MKAQPRVILRRIQSAAAICAAVPLALFAILQAGGTSSAPDGQSREELLGQIALPVTAQASALEQRLHAVEDQVRMLKAYAAEVLKSPEIYAGPQSRTSAISGSPAAAPPTGQAKQPGETSNQPATPALPAPGLDNPLLYTKGGDGAIRKLIDDGRPAVFFRARGSGQFTVRDKQRLLASAALDPLLRQLGSGPLAGQAFMLTADSLLRTAPFRDISGLPATRDLTQTPLYAWKADKADARGIVWTTPYPSMLSGKWVIAALAGVEFGGKLSAVVGAEVPCSALEEQALTFPLGRGALSWLQRSDGVLLAAPAASEAELGVQPLASAELPTEDKGGKKILDASNLYLKGKEQLAKPLAQMQSSRETAVEPIKTEGATRYAATAPIGATGLRLGALLESPLADEVLSVEGQRGLAIRRLLSALLIAMALAALLVMGASWFVARRISVPLTVLTQQVREASRGRIVPVAMAEESEIGALSRAVQELIDRRAD